jgi:4-hydroxy-3-methylbut-2-en-1-yl diphosphate synthase IspG/GcpE
MTNAGQHHHFFPGIFFQPGCHCLGHGLVPQGLGLNKIIKMLGFKYLRKTFKELGLKDTVLSRNLMDMSTRRRGIEMISCPTCGRAEIDVISLASRIEKRLFPVKTPLKIAVMGCVVNGPGEAEEADIGVAGGKNIGILFKKGVLVRRVPPKELEETLVSEIRILTGEVIP